MKPNHPRSRTLIIYAHPNPRSFNRALLDTVARVLSAKNHEVRIRDLYYDAPFNCVLTAQDLASIGKGDVPTDILDEQRLIDWAENLVFVYPIWWFDRPALLKGWIDRVLTHGYAYRVTPSGIEGLLRIKRALVLQTAGSSEESVPREAVEASMRDGTLRFCGIPKVEMKTFYTVPSATPAERTAMLNLVENTILNDW